MQFGIPWVSEQSTLALCSPPWPEERARKDAPNIGLSLHPGLLSKVGGDAIYAVKITSLKKFDITNHWHMESVYAHRQHQSWPESQTALTARELGRCNIHITALSENTLSNKNSSGYTFFGAVATVKNVVKWERVFAFRNDAISKRTNLSKRFNDYLTTPRHHYQCICTNNDESRRPMINSTSIWKTSLKA